MWLTRICFALFVLGLMLAVTGAAKVPSPDLVWAGQTWPDTVPLFAAGLALCVVGLVGWRVGLRHEDATGALSSLGPEGMMQIIIDCRRATEQLRDEIDRRQNMVPELIRDKVDSISVTYFEPFVENRFILIEHYGMRHGAELLLQFALTERYINRVWSATADGCPEEARASLETAVAALKDLSTRAETELQTL
ncbi:MAG: hypothetical protein JXM70_10295 [Pirellulales bacterium]|nr:hypothetical protein [Pirellulales bacterium]